MDEYVDHEPGEAALPTKLIGEEWTDEDEQTIAVLVDDVRTPEGRELRAGDVISPAEARRLRARFTIDKSRRDVDRGDVVGIQPPGGWS